MYYDKVLAIAEAEVGYMEKKSNSNLDSKTGNAGNGNYTKYWRDLRPAFQGQPWCQCFANWCLVQAYGKEMTQKMIYHEGGLGDFYTPDNVEWFKKANAWSNEPKIGAFIYFKNATRVHHVELVTGFDSSRVYTIGGNTSNGDDVVVANGGMVCKKSYDRKASVIAGYGFPNYDLVEKEPEPVKPAEESKWEITDMHDLYRGLKGIAEIYTLQRLLKSLGYYTGKIDGSFGAGTESAVIKFQKAKGIVVNEPGTVGPKTWKVLLTQCK